MDERAPFPSVPDAKPVLDGAKRQHYLPRFYLEQGWADQRGLLWVYDRSVDKVRQQPPKDTTVERHLYTFQDAEGRNRFEVESMLADIEGVVSTILGKLPGQQRITDDERATLSLFIGLQAYRTPESFDTIGQMNSDMIEHVMHMLAKDPDNLAESMAHRMNKPVDDEVRQQVAEMVAFVQSGKYEVITHRPYARALGMNLGRDIGSLLERRCWTVLRSPERCSFVVSDSPVVVTSQSNHPERRQRGTGWGCEDAMILFPLDHRHTLVMDGTGPSLDFATCKPDFVRWSNLVQTDQCQRFVVGRSDRLLLSLKEATGIARREWQPRMRVRNRFDE